MKQLTSRDNAEYKALRKLAESGRERRKSGRIVIDGLHLVEAYRLAYGMPETIVVSAKGALRAEIAAWLADFPEARVIALPDALFSALTEVESPSGILAVAARPAPLRPVSNCADTIVLDGVQDPGNLGSILRSAAAAGCSQAVLSPDCAQVWSPRVLRAAMGAHFHIDLHEGIGLAGFLAAFQGQAVLTALDGKDSLYDLDLRTPTAWVFGNEGQGVRSELAVSVRHKVRIPMPGPSESLNVAAAAAICLFEGVRQRQ